MNWQDFKTKLQQHPDLHLRFTYAEGKQVDDAYHITEIKQAPITSVDCGGVMNVWTEIIIQLWEPPQKEAGRAMQVHKALKIADIVESKLPLNPDGIVKIEFGNSGFDTRQMYPADFITNGDHLIIPLSPDFTQCKAIGRNESCGTGTQEAACCQPVQTTLAQQTPARDTIEDACCTPGSGCC